MKRWRLIVVVCLVTLQSIASPYRRNEHNYFVIEAGVGYQALLTSSSEISPSGGAAAQLGIGYRYAKHTFLFHLGLEGQFGYITNRLNAISDSTIIEQEGLSITRKGEMNQRFEAYRMANIALPLAAGCDFGPFYFLAGLKPALSIWGDGKAEAHVQSWSEYYGVLPGTQSNIFVQSNGGAYESMKWNFQLLAHIELGGPIRLPNQTKKSPVQLKWGIWADCGILNTYSPNQNQESVPMQAPYTDATVRPTIKYNADITSRPLAVGAKITLLLGLKQRKTCMCLRN